MSETPARPGPIRWISVGAFVAWACLFATTYGYAPGFGRAWGFNLLAYLPEWFAWGTTAFALVMTTDEARRGVIAAGRWLGARLAALPAPAQGALLFALAFGVLWLLRQRVQPGDAEITILVLAQPSRPAFPETGGTWLLTQLFSLAGASGWNTLGFLQAVLCATGAGAVLFVTRAARMAAPEGRATVAVALLAFSGGVGAAIAGRIDVQVLSIAAAGVYFWAGLRHLSGRPGVMTPALALGVLVWLEPFALVLIPSLLWISRGRGARHLVAALGLALLPLALHIAFLLAVNPKDLSAATVVLRALGSARGWVGLPGVASGLGTDYVLGSAGHLKYLANAIFVLAGGAFVVAGGAFVVAGGAGLVATHRWKLVADAPSVFLSVAAAGLVVATVLTRPSWGPWDWDLFGITGVALALLAGTLLAHLADARRLHIAVAVASLQLCFLGIPLIGLGFGTRTDAGPFFEKRFDAGLFQRDRVPEPRIAPWL